GGLVGRLAGRFGEHRTLVAGLLFGMVGFAIYGLAGTGFAFAVGIPIMSMWGLYGPSAQGLVTRRVGPTEQGKLQGALSSVMGITGIVGPGLFTLTFSSAISRWKLWFLIGAPFLLASALLWVGVLLALGVRPAAHKTFHMKNEGLEQG